jgi:hypothetical protein
MSQEEVVGDCAEQKKSKSKNVPNTLQMMEDEQEMSGGCVRGSGGVRMCVSGVW